MQVAPLSAPATRSLMTTTTSRVRVRRMWSARPSTPKTRSGTS